MNRRDLLKAFAVIPAMLPQGLHVASEQAKMRLAGISGVGGAEPITGTNQGEVKFGSFTEWLLLGGHDQIERNARRVDGLDPEIVEMHLPLATKVRMQRRRNLAREYRNAEFNIKRMLRQQGGKASYWF